MTTIAGSESISWRQGSADPDPHQNVMDPQHCSQELSTGVEDISSRRVVRLAANIDTGAQVM